MLSFLIWVWWIRDQCCPLVLHREAAQSLNRVINTVYILCDSPVHKPSQASRASFFVIRVWLWKNIYKCHECVMTFIPWCIVASWEPLGFYGRSAGAKSISHQVSGLWSVFQIADSMWGWISYKTVPGWCYSAIKKKRLSASWRGSPKIIWQVSLIMWLASVEKEWKSEQTKYGVTAATPSLWTLCWLIFWYIIVC